MHSRSCATTARTQFPEHLRRPGGGSGLTEQPCSKLPPAPTPTPPATGTCFLSRWIHPVWTSHINRGTRHAAFRDRLLSLGVMFAVSVLSGGVSVSVLLCGQITLHPMNTLPFVCSCVAGRSGWFCRLTLVTEPLRTRCTSFGSKPVLSSSGNRRII